MRFLDIVQDYEGCLLPYNTLSHLYRKCGHDGVKLEVPLRNQRKVICPIINLTNQSYNCKICTSDFYNCHLGFLVHVDVTR